jgi:rubrerythrin
MLPIVSMKELALAFVACVAVLAPAAAQPPAIPRATVDNLAATIEREANAERRYTAYARKADTEGYAQVAKLFRAAALAESVLRRNHEQVLRDAGTAAKEPSLEGVLIGTTAANLQVAIGATAEGSEVYYDFVEQARSDDAPGAERTFQYALAAERAHLEFFKRALARLGDNPPENYYVGHVSGETTTTMTDREPYTAVR